MPWANPTRPNLPDYILFVQQVMDIDPLLLPSVATPATPALTAGSSGSLATGAVYVRTTYVSALGETVGSPEAQIAVTGPSGSVQVTSPPAVTGATGYSIYAAPAPNAETLQNTAPVAIGTNYSITTLMSGVSPPTDDTASSPWITYAFDQARDLVLIPGGSAPWGFARGPGSAGIGYTLAVYNCAGHIQIRITPDEDGRTFFKESRATFGMLKMSVGLVQATSNVDTSSTFAVPDSLKQLTLSDLGFMTTPWGRDFLSYNQDYGPSVWGLS